MNSETHKHEMITHQLIEYEFLMTITYCKHCGITREKVLEEALKEINNVNGLDWKDAAKEMGKIAFYALGCPI